MPFARNAPSDWPAVPLILINTWSSGKTDIPILVVTSEDNLVPRARSVFWILYVNWIFWLLSKSFLAGGLNNENVGQALEQLTQVDLFGLDLNSGVEDSPGIKSSEKLAQVFSQIRNY